MTDTNFGSGSQARNKPPQFMPKATQIFMASLASRASLIYGDASNTVGGYSPFGSLTSGLKKKSLSKDDLATLVRFGGLKAIADALEEEEKQKKSSYSPFSGLT